MDGKFIFSLFFLVQASYTSGNENAGNLSTGRVGATTMLQDLYTFCPYNKFCKSLPLKDNTDERMVPCCEKCSCDVKCYEIGNCCPDIPFSPAGGVKYPCTKVSKDGNYDMWYHIIDDCKDARAGQQYPQCFETKELNENILVSSTENGRVYKNKYCAMCNDVTDYVTWNLYVACPEVLRTHFNTKEERDGFVFQNQDICLPHSVPPENDISEISRCFGDDSVITNCNTTGIWNHYDKKLEDACKDAGLNPEQNIIFVYTGRYKIQKYANVFCYLCNTPKNKHEFREDLCDASLYNISSKNVLPSFSGIIEFQEVNEEEDRNRKCKFDELWDPFKNLCRVVKCPSGTIPNDGKCKSILKYSTHYVIQVVFEVTVDNSSNVLVYSRLIDFLGAYLHSRFDKNCGHLSMYLYNPYNYTLMFLGNVYTTKLCPLDAILTELHKIAINEPVRLEYKTLKNNRFTLSLRLVLGNYKFDHLDIVTSKTTYLHISSYRLILDSSILHYCPSIELTLSEFISLGLNTNTTMYTGYDITNEMQKISVCVDTYLWAYNTRYSGTGNYIGSRMYFMCLIIHFILSFKN